jgi:hypothetical protein
MMRKFSRVLVGGLLLASAVNVQAIEQTICFSYKDTGQRVGNYVVKVGMLGDDVTLHSGKCRGVKLADMNKRGWKLVFVVTGLESSFGMVFERVSKKRRR